MVVAVASQIRFTPFFVARALNAGRPATEYLQFFSAKIFARWGSDAVEIAQIQTRDTVKTPAEKLIFSALGEIATARYQTYSEFRGRELSVYKLAHHAVEFCRQINSYELSDYLAYLNTDEFRLKAMEVTEGRDLWVNTPDDASRACAQREFPGYTLRDDADVIQTTDSTVLAINTSVNKKRKLREALNQDGCLRKGFDGTSRSPMDYLKEIGTNILITTTKGSGRSYSRLSQSGNLIILLADEDDPITALDDALVRIYFCDELKIKQHVTQAAELPELTTNWDWLTARANRKQMALIEQYCAGNLVQLMEALRNEHWVLNKSVLSLIGNKICENLRNRWLDLFRTIDLNTRAGLEQAIALLVPEDVEGIRALSKDQIALGREIVALRPFLEHAKRRAVIDEADVSPILTIQPALGEKLPGNSRSTSGLVFMSGNPRLVKIRPQAFIPVEDPTGLTYFNDAEHLGIIDRTNTAVVPSRNIRPGLGDGKPKALDQTVTAEELAACPFCHSDKMTGPIIDCGRMTPDQWLAMGPYAARLLGVFEYLPEISAIAGTNKYPSAGYHLLSTIGQHPRTNAMRDVTVAMWMAEHHATHQAIARILSHPAINRVEAGKNFGTSVLPFPAGATFAHPHAQSSASPVNNVADTLSQRVDRYNRRKKSPQDYMGGFLDASRAAGLVIYEDDFVAVMSAFDAHANDGLWVTMKNPEHGNPLMFGEVEEGHLNFAMGLALFGIARIPGIRGAIYSFGTNYYGRPKAELNSPMNLQGQRMTWGIDPLQSTYGYRERQGSYVISRDPVDSAAIMRRTLNVYYMAALFDETDNPESEEIQMLADFVSREPAYQRFYELTGADDFAALLRSVKEI